MADGNEELRKRILLVIGRLNHEYRSQHAGEKVVGSCGLFSCHAFSSVSLHFVVVQTEETDNGRSTYAFFVRYVFWRFWQGSWTLAKKHSHNECWFPETKAGIATGAGILCAVLVFLSFQMHGESFGVFCFFSFFFALTGFLLNVCFEFARVRLPRFSSLLALVLWS